MSERATHPLQSDAQQLGRNGRTSAAHHPSSMSPATESVQVQGHHFPLYSHPMFRAAIHNAHAVRNAWDAQVEQVDPAALDDAVEKMVEELLRQQATAAGQQEGQAPTADVAVSEAQLLALLASVTPTQPPPSAAKASMSSAVENKETSTQPVEAFASSSGLLSRPLPTSTRYSHYVPCSHTAEDVPSTEKVQVVSVKALQRAAAAYTRRTSQLDPSTISPYSSHTINNNNNACATSPYVSHIPHAPISVRDVASGARPSPVAKPLSEAATSPLPGAPSSSALSATAASSCTTPQPALRPIGLAASHPSPALTRSGLYSMLPTSSTREGSGNSQVASGTAARGITFAEMDRRPGVGTGPVAQQSVDKSRLHGVSDAVFASMDVLMDGNSCCVRRRQRGPLHGTTRLAAKTTPLGHLPLTIRSSSDLYSLASPAPAQGLSVPPPRNAAEAKARRIQEAQRRRQRLQEPPGPAANASASAASRADLDSRTTQNQAASPAQSLPPLYTVRGMASSSLFARAIHSVHDFNPPYK